MVSGTEPFKSLSTGRGSPRRRSASGKLGITARSPRPQLPATARTGPRRPQKNSPHAAKRRRPWRQKQPQARTPARAAANMHSRATHAVRAAADMYSRATHAVRAAADMHSRATHAARAAADNCACAKRPVARAADIPDQAAHRAPAPRQKSRTVRTAVHHDLLKCAQARRWVLRGGTFLGEWVPG